MTSRSQALAITGTIGFVLFSVVVVLGWVVPVDRFVTASLAPLAGPLFVYVTELGSVKVLIGLSFIGMLYFLWRGNRFEAFRLPIVVIATLLVTQILKLVFGSIDRQSMSRSTRRRIVSRAATPRGHSPYMACLPFCYIAALKTGSGSACLSQWCSPSRSAGSS